MKILQLCKKFPYPLKDGESLAVNTLSKSLKKLGCQVTLLAMNTKKHYSSFSTMPDAVAHYHAIYTAEVDNRIKPIDAFLNLFSKESYHISRFVSDDFQNQLIRLLKSQSFDIIQLETLYLAPYIPVIRRYSKAVIAMRAHNVEHEIWERISKNTALLPKRWYLTHLTKKLKRFEAEQLSAYDLLVAITQKDLKTYQKLGFKGKGLVTPIGIESADYQPDFQSYKKKISLSFIGSLDWMPNQEGLVWFLDQVWCKLSRKFPELELHIAGRNTPEWMMNLKKKNVVVHGEVPSAADFINQHSIMVVPLLSGSGMRAKILEGMALGKVVLTTSIGMEGIHARDKMEVLVANKTNEFIKAIEFCYKHPDQFYQIGQQAKNFVHQFYDSKAISRQLLETYSSFLMPTVQEER